jgi:hypothetical protein
VKRFLISLSTLVGSVIGFVGCSESTPPASPRSDVRDVYVHRADEKPDFVRVERDGDPTAALAVAYMHGANASISQTIGKHVADELTKSGYVASVIPAEAGLLVSVSVDDELTASTRAVSLVRSIREALGAAHRRASSEPEVSPPAPNPCGSIAVAASSSAPSYRNTVLAAVGTGARLEAIHAAYEADAAWSSGAPPEPALPNHDEFASSPATMPAELVVAVRTPLRQRIVPAARDVGEPDSLLSILAESYAGAWKLRSSFASFISAGGCLAVHLEAQRPVAAIDAARTAKAVLHELRWVLTEQTADEDPRFNILEAPSADEAARRAAWEAATRHGLAKEASSTGFVHYRGDVDAETWKSLMTAPSPSVELPLVTRDERGQGRVWALLENTCPLAGEDNTTAGHATAALLAMSRSMPGSRLELLASWQQQGLAGWQPTQEPGAEDRLAEAIARAVLTTLRTPGLANQLLRQPESALDTPPWTLALTLATNGHPSWLSARSTPQSRAVFDGGTLGSATRRFVSGPLQLSVLTNHGPSQSARLGARLAHLLSGVHASNPECPAATPGAPPSPAGEYEVAAPDGAHAVALYVVDRRFATAVRHLADGLNQPGGWLRRAVEPLGAQVTAVGLGTPATMAALGFTVSSESREAMDAALGQLRVLIAELPKAPATGLTSPTVENPNPPVERLAELARNTDPATTTAPSSVSALVAEGLTERRLFVVRPLARPKAPNSSNPK